MAENKKEHLTVANANINEMERELIGGRFGEHLMVDLVASLLVAHYGHEFNQRNDFQLGVLLVRESILSHHGQLINDYYPGRYALKVLRSAKDGRLGLIFNPQSRLHPLLFTGLNS
ncbi:hypothetical protein ACET98_23630 [Aeromonas veronii]